MYSSSSVIDELPETAVTLSEDEVVTLFLNMIAFNGDWDAHLEFLRSVDKDVDWRSSQIPLVRDMERKDYEFGIQDKIA